MNVSEELIREIVTKVIQAASAGESKDDFEKHVDPSGIIGINGAAAHLVKEGDIVIIASYCSMEFEEAKKHKPYIIFPDKDNKI